MTLTLQRLFVAASAVCLFLTPAVMAAPPTTDGHLITWTVDKAGSDLVELTVAGPAGFRFSTTNKAGALSLSIFDQAGFTLADGLYKYSLVSRPSIAQDRDGLSAAEIDALRFAGKTERTESGVFRVVKGAFMIPGGVIESGTDSDIPLKDHVILDDLIVDGSACIGFDCVNGEVFGFDTIRLKENNLRIKFLDTSGNNFPTTDWQLTANDSAAGGANKFSIDDIDNGRTPFTIEARAPSHSLYVDDGGRLGLGTSIPVVDLHVVSGNSPTLRLEQNGSSGFAPQTWDVAGNETSFFIRDASNGSTLPFRLRPGAPSQALVIDGDGDIGVGILSPTQSLHVNGTDGSTQVFIDENNGTTANRTLLKLQNDGGTTIELENTSLNGNQWSFLSSDDGNFVITAIGSGATEMRLGAGPGGDLTITGDIITNNCPVGCGPDYVFEDDYALMDLDELASYIEQNNHLPNVPPAVEMETEGINMTQLQLRMLEKIEELTLYTLQQHESLQQQQQTIEALQERLEALDQ